MMDSRFDAGRSAVRPLGGSGGGGELAGSRRVTEAADTSIYAPAPALVVPQLARRRFTINTRQRFR